MAVPLTGPDGQELKGVAEWKEAMPARVRERWSRSAAEIAYSWGDGGIPAEVAELLDARPETRGFAPSYARPEGATAIDRFPGGDRSHDLLLAGAAGDTSVVVGIEAKTDEPFDASLERYRARAMAKRASGEKTNAPERLDGLITCLFGPTANEAEWLGGLGYQLLSGAVGVLAEAQERHAALGLFLIQEFAEGHDERKIERNAAVLESFVAHLPGAPAHRVTTSSGWLEGPFTCPGNDFVPRPVPLLVGKVRSPAKARR